MYRAHYRRSLTELLIHGVALPNVSMRLRRAYFILQRRKVRQIFGPSLWAIVAENKALRQENDAVNGAALTE